MAITDQERQKIEEEEKVRAGVRDKIEKKKKNQKTLGCLGIILIIVVLSIIGLVSIGKNRKSTSDVTNSSSQSSTTTQNTNTQKVYAVGEDVRVADVRWKLLNAKVRGNTLKASESRYAGIAKDKTTPGKFVEITMEVENLGSDLKSVTNLTLVDSKNREYTSSSDTSEWVPEGKDLFLLSNLNPNVPEQFIAIYEVPNDASSLKVKVGDLDLFGNKEATISLGI